MASTRTCLSQLTRTTLSRPNLYVPSISIQQRGAAQSANAQKYKRKELPTSQRKKKSRTTFINHDLKDAIQFPLVDAMRYGPLLVLHHIQSLFLRHRPREGQTDSIQIHSRNRSRSRANILQVRTPPPTQISQERSCGPQPYPPPTSRKDRSTHRCYL